MGMGKLALMAFHSMRLVYMGAESFGSVAAEESQKPARFKLLQYAEVHPHRCLSTAITRSLSPREEFGEPLRLMSCRSPVYISANRKN